MMTNCRGKGLAAAGDSEEISTEKPRKMGLGSNPYISISPFLEGNSDVDSTQSASASLPIKVLAHQVSNWVKDPVIMYESKGRARQKLLSSSSHGQCKGDHGKKDPWGERVCHCFHLHLFFQKVYTPQMGRAPNIAVKPNGRWMDKILWESPQIIIPFSNIVKWVSVSYRSTNYHFSTPDIFCHK